MKLLLVQNPSFRLADQLESLFPGSKHVKDFNLTEDDDEEVWDFAAREGYTSVFKGFRFHVMHCTSRYSTKGDIYWLRELSSLLAEPIKSKISQITPRNRWS